MKNKWTWIIAAIAIVALLGIAFILKSVSGGSSKDDHDGYDTYKVKRENAIHLEGKAAPNAVKTYNNNSQVGDFQSPAVQDGDQVKQGTPLVSYDTNNGKRQELANKVNDIQHAVNEDQLRVNAAPNDQNTQQKLAEDQNTLSQTQQQLNKFDRQVTDSVNAAFDGKVDIKNPHASEGEAILRLISKEPQLKATVSEFDISKIKEGDHVNVKVNNSGKTGEGKITKISELPTSFDKAGASGGSSQGNPVDKNPGGGESNSASKYTVEIGNIDIPVRAGFSMEASIPLKTVKLPDSVLTKDDQVFVVDEHNKAHKLKIKIDKMNGQIIVKKGLKPGDKVLKNPKKTLNDGDKVEVSS